MTPCTPPGRGGRGHRSGRRGAAAGQGRGAEAQERQTDVQAGINIVLKALEAPIRQIAENSGVEGSIVVGRINDNSSETYSFDAQSEPF